MTCNNSESVKNSEVVLVCVKPHLVSRVLREVAPSITRDHLFISVAAGVTLQTLEKV